jgi:hypothetical protein
MKLMFNVSKIKIKTLMLNPMGMSQARLRISVRFVIRLRLLDKISIGFYLINFINLAVKVLNDNVTFFIIFNFQNSYLNRFKFDNRVHIVSRLYAEVFFWNSVNWKLWFVLLWFVCLLRFYLLLYWLILIRI